MTLALLGSGIALIAAGVALLRTRKHKKTPAHSDKE